MEESKRSEGGPDQGVGWPYVMTPEAELETLRRSHLRVETSIRAIGLLELISGVGGLLAFPISLKLLGSEILSPFSLVWGVIAAIGSVVSGVWLRRFDPRGRMLFTVLGLIGSVVTCFVGRNQFDDSTEYAIAVGGQLAIAALFLWMLWRPQARTIFGAHYRNIVMPATAHIRRPRSRIWLLLVGLAMLIGIVSIVRAFAGT